jgi:uracil-DNA glycosylase
MDELLNEIRGCTLCAGNLPLGPRPVLSGHEDSKVIIIGQAPGTKVHASGIPWDDQSGKALRSWMNVSNEEFYDPIKFAIIPMGFCYPGKGRSGDLLPRPECAETWHARLLSKMQSVELVLLIGQYAQRAYLDQSEKRNLTETVRRFDEFGPMYLPLPHPSPRNRFWLQKNPWFETDVIPYLQIRLQQINFIK